LDLHFHLLAACRNSIGVGLNWPRLQTRTVFSGVRRPKCKADHMHLLTRFYPYVELQTELLETSDISAISIVTSKTAIVCGKLLMFIGPCIVIIF
jgi:hypothetical protein